MHWQLALWGWIALVASSQALGKVSVSKSNNELEARITLAQKLQKLGSSIASGDGGTSGGGAQKMNRNDRNNFSAQTTYHTYVWDYCLNWVESQSCNRWLDPYIPLHGMGKERSELEAKVAEQWLANENKKSETQYKIWNVESEGAIDDLDGRLDRKNLKKFELTDEVRSISEKIGINHANKELANTYGTGPEERKGTTMPNMESLRMMASYWTKEFRNRMVAITGELRSAQPGIELALSEENPDGRTAVEAIKKDKDPASIDNEKLRNQAPLDPDTFGKGLQKRLALSDEIRNRSLYDINPTVEGDEIKPGVQDHEAIDSWRARMNIAVIDSAGIDPNKIPKPASAKLSEKDIAGDVYEYAAGGKQYRTIRQSNAQQMQGYNDNLERAAVQMEAMAALSPNIPPNGDKIRGWKTAPETTDLVKYNGLTPEMKNELKDTPMEGTTIEPDQHTLEITPAQLTIRAASKM